MRGRSVATSTADSGASRFDEGQGQDLGGDRLGVLVECLPHVLIVRRPPGVDPVRHLEAGELAPLLHGPNDLAREASPAQLVVEVQVEGQALAALRDDGPSLARRLGDDHLAVGHVDGAELVRGNGRRPVGTQRGHENGGIACGDGGRDDGGLLREPLAERAEVRLHRDIDEPGRLIGKGLELLDVELLRDLHAERVREGGPPRRGDQGAAQWLPRPDRRGGPRGSPELDQSSDQGHLLGELRLD